MLSRVVAYVQQMARRRQLNAEIEDELSFHLEQEIQEHVARGLPPVEARRVALRDLGGVAQTREAMRAVRMTWLDSGRTAHSDLLHLWRYVRRSPMSALAAVITLSLTLGTAASIFAVVDVVLLTATSTRPTAR